MPGGQYIGEIFLSGMNFPPRGFAFCQGQILSIATNTALFSLLGTTFGGNGQTTFALPDLRGRTPIGTGQGAGLPNIDLGQISGVESITLLPSEIPVHTHVLNAVSIGGDSSNPQNAVLANTGALDKEYKTAPTASIVQMHTSTVSNAGGSQPHNNMSPYLGLNFYIALVGIYPARN